MSIDYDLLNSLLEDGSSQSLLKIKCSFDVSKIELRHINSKNVIMFLNLFFDYYSEWFKSNPDNFTFITCEHEIEVLELFKVIFNNAFKDDSWFIGNVSYENQLKVLVMFKESFTISFKDNPNAIRRLRTDDDEIRVLEMFKESFSIGFKNDPSAIRYINENNLDKAKKLFPDIDFPF